MSLVQSREMLEVHYNDRQAVSGQAHPKNVRKAEEDLLEIQSVATRLASGGSYQLSISIVHRSIWSGKAIE